MSQGITRRDFVKASIMLGAGTAIASPSGFQAPGNTNKASSTPKAEWRNKQPEMRYRRLGRPGFMISEIVCGGDPIAPDNNRHVEMAIEMGLNYLDTASAYGVGKSEMGYSAVIQGAKRDRVFINTKISPLTSSRYQAYQKIFDALGPEEQAAILREVSEDIERRRVTVPNYFGNYF